MQAEYKINQEKNQIEIYFPGVPDKSIRDVIKENGYRWNRELSAWCNSHNDEALEIAKRVVSGEFDSTKSTSNGKSVPKEWSGHTFTEEEISQLEAGGKIRLTDCVSKRTGKTFSCSVTWDGTKINPQFDERESSAGSSRGVPKKWAGRMFSDSEMDQLGRGETIEVWGCVSKSGNDFDCFISWSEYGGISIEAFVTMDQDAIYDDWEGGGWLTHK